jgi:short chain dehydrogenase
MPRRGLSPGAGMAVALLARHTGFTSALAQELPDCKSLRLRRFRCVVGRPSLRRDPHRDGRPGGTHLQCGSGVWGDVESITLNEFEAAWRVNAYGALATTREVIPAMKTAGAGAIIFIGATASRRGD